jgi:metalloproteinase inhibitor 3
MALYQKNFFNTRNIFFFSLKMNEKAKLYLKHGRLMTAPNDAMCGYEFKIGQLYAIAGRSASVGLCDYIKEYSKLTMVEKRGIAGGYKRGCACEVRYFNGLFK